MKKSPVGTPSRATVASTGAFQRRCARSFEGASRLFLRCRCQASHSTASALPVMLAQAALWVPSRGSPSQPRMKAGVSSTQTEDATASALSGVTVSPRPRSSAASIRCTNSTGIAANSTRA